MKRRPYRGSGETFEGAELSRPGTADDAALFNLLLSHPDFLDEDVVFVGDGRVLLESDPARRTVFGWHRRGGPVLLALTTGEAPADLLVEVAQLADTSAEWPIERWNAALAAWWETADPSLFKNVAKRWSLPVEEPWSIQDYTHAAWKEDPAPGRAAIGILASDVPPALQRAVNWLVVAGKKVAAWEVRRMTGEDRATYWTDLVAGGWRHVGEGYPPSDQEKLRREIYVRHTGGATAALLAGVESCCARAESSVAWSGEDWVRFDGPEGSLRVFPGAAWVDLQFVDADEGTLTGLHFRYGVPESLDPPEDAPPEVHLRLTSANDLTAGVDLLISSWLTTPRPIKDTGSKSRRRRVETKST